MAGTLAKKELPAEGCSRRNGERKKVRGRRRYQMIDNIMINGLYADTKRKAEKRVNSSCCYIIFKFVDSLFLFSILLVLIVQLFDTCEYIEQYFINIKQITEHNVCKPSRCPLIESVKKYWTPKYCQLYHSSLTLLLSRKSCF